MNLHGTKTRWAALAAAGVLVVGVVGSAAASALEWDDADGNGVADTCQEAVVADDAAAQAAFDLADLNGDGTISVSEAAQTGWIGGTNCNHGGYVSSVANAAADACDESATDESETEESVVEESVVETDCETASEETTEDPEAADEASEATCEPTVDEPTVDDPPVDESPNAHGKAVSAVAQSDAIGGKNCNHGGAVSEVAKGEHGHNGADHAAIKAAKQAAKDAKQAAKTHGKGHQQQD
jgi:hypothetical protein